MQESWSEERDESRGLKVTHLRHSKTQSIQQHMGFISSSVYFVKVAATHLEYFDWTTEMWNKSNTFNSFNVPGRVFFRHIHTVWSPWRPGRVSAVNQDSQTCKRCKWTACQLMLMSMLKWHHRDTLGAIRCKVIINNSAYCWALGAFRCMSDMLVHRVTLKFMLCMCMKECRRVFVKRSGCVAQGGST